MKIHVVLGTRPEIIKLAPIIHELEKRKIEFQIIHTGQHYSENMDKIFWDTFKLPKPAYHLAVQQPTHATQTAEMLSKLEKIFLTEKPDWLVVQGDTNSTMSAALTAAKLNTIKIAHVEAGLRSGDRTMPEEINRIIVDKISDLLFPPTKESGDFLLAEGIKKEQIVMCGNTIKDALDQQLPEALKKTSVLTELGLKSKKYLLLTVHRQENTDNPERLSNILNSIFKNAKEAGLEVVFPIHPRTENRLNSNGFKFPPFVKLLKPIDYHSFLLLEKEAALIATDSGGIQEEACILGVPCITLRENTERPETLKVGSNVLAGVDPKKISDAFTKSQVLPKGWKQPYGEGNSALIIVNAILRT